MGDLFMNRTRGVSRVVRFICTCRHVGIRCVNSRFDWIVLLFLCRGLLSKYTAKCKQKKKDWQAAAKLGRLPIRHEKHVMAHNT